MRLTLRPMAGLSRFLSDWPTSFLDRDFFDIESGLSSARLGVNVPSVNIRETPKEYILEVAAPGLERKDFSIEVDNHTLSISAEKEEKKEEKTIALKRKLTDLKKDYKSGEVPRVNRCDYFM